MNKRIAYLGIGLFLLPLIAAGGFMLIVRLQAIFRYDPAYFTPAYQKQYASPGAVASAIEQGLRGENQEIFAELTGLRRKIQPPEANPNLRLMILLEVTDRDYYQFLFFDIQNYHRLLIPVKEVGRRWVMAPQDLYYYLDSGDWLLFFTPALAIYWSLLAVILVGAGIYRLAASFRRQLYQQVGERPGERMSERMSEPARERGKHDKIDH